MHCSAMQRGAVLLDCKWPNSEQSKHGNAPLPVFLLSCRFGHRVERVPVPAVNLHVQTFPSTHQPLWAASHSACIAQSTTRRGKTGQEKGTGMGAGSGRERHSRSRSAVHESNRDSASSPRSSDFRPTSELSTSLAFPPFGQRTLSSGMWDTISTMLHLSMPSPLVT